MQRNCQKAKGQGVEGQTRQDLGVGRKKQKNTLRFVDLLRTEKKRNREEQQHTIALWK